MIVETGPNYAVQAQTHNPPASAGLGLQTHTSMISLHNSLKPPLYILSLIHLQYN